MSLQTLRAEAGAMWPDVDWSGASLAQGAFHDVLLTDAGVVARLSRSRFAADAMESRADLLRALPRRVGALTVPDVIGAVQRRSETRAGVVIEFVPGESRSHLDAIPAAGMADVLAAVRSIDGTVLRRDALRAWCGGADFLRLVSDVVAPRIPEDAAPQATAVVLALLDAESRAPECPLHGDLTPFNIRWSGDTPTGLVDWDFATIGDPSLDIAGVLTTLGRATAAQLCDAETLERAAIHRATFPLQIACAGHLHDDPRLLETGVANFTNRVRANTLYWP